MTSLISLLQPSMAHQQIASGTRWYPTPEQLAILRALYGRGIRTLCGSQIRQIAAYLSVYGRIEPKNVFYWFQNRKARDRQKLRRSFSQQQKTSSTFSQQLLQGGIEETAQMANLVCEQKQMSGSNEHSWVRILNLEPNARPVETLELFPTKSDGDLK